MNTYKERRSIRNFSDKAVPAELINSVIEAGLYAASGMGRQSARIIAITDKAFRDRISEVNGKICGRDEDPFYGAPVILMVIADKNVPTHVYDGSLVLGNMMNKAWELGLGSCWIHRAKEELEMEIGKEMLEKLGITGEFEGIGHLALGYINGGIPEAKPVNEGRVFYI